MKKLFLIILSLALVFIICSRIVYIEDYVGRLLLPRILKASFLSILIALSALFIELFIGTVYGTVSAYYSGYLDTIMFSFIKALSSIPNFIFMVFFLMIFDSGFTSLAVALSFSRWIGIATIIRTEVLSLRERAFIKSSKLMGRTFPWIFYKHLFPFIKKQILIKAIFSFPRIIFYEAMLSFIGINKFATLGSIIVEGYYYSRIQFMIASLVFYIIIIFFNMILRRVEDTW